MNKKTKWFKSIRTRFIGIMAVMLILTAGMVYLILHTVMHDKINILEDKYIIENVERTKKEIFKEIEVLDTIVMDWAVWDNSYQFMIDKNPEYIKKLNRLWKWKADRIEKILNKIKIDSIIWQDFAEILEKNKEIYWDNSIFGETYHKLIDGFLTSLSKKVSKKSWDFIYKARKK